MSSHLAAACLAASIFFSLGAICNAQAQSPATTLDPAKAAPPRIPDAPMSSGDGVDPKLKDLFQAKVQAEWEALKNKDRKAYGSLIADDYLGVEVDGKGERTKSQMLNEVPEGNVNHYALWGFRVLPLGPDAALVTYESTMQFPPNAQVRLLRIYITELWVKRSGEWKELRSQETNVK